MILVSIDVVLADATHDNVKSSVDKSEGSLDITLMETCLGVGVHRYSRADPIEIHFAEPISKLL